MSSSRNTPAWSRVKWGTTHHACKLIRHDNHLFTPVNSPLAPCLVGQRLFERVQPGGVERAC